VWQVKSSALFVYCEGGTSIGGGKEFRVLGGKALDTIVEMNRQYSEDYQGDVCMPL
jgi:hypothetical protein